MNEEIEKFIKENGMDIAKLASALFIKERLTEAKDLCPTMIKFLESLENPVPSTLVVSCIASLLVIALGSGDEESGSDFIIQVEEIFGAIKKSRHKFYEVIS